MEMQGYPFNDGFTLYEQIGDPVAGFPVIISQITGQQTHIFSVRTSLTCDANLAVRTVYWQINIGGFVVDRCNATNTQATGTTVVYNWSSNWTGEQQLFAGEVRANFPRDYFFAGGAAVLTISAFNLQAGDQFHDTWLGEHNFLLG